MRFLNTFALLLSLILTPCYVIAATPAQRVITLSPSATEMAYAAGMGENMVAASAYSDYPQAAKALVQVADWQGINVERILLLKPDLIIAWPSGNPQRPLDQLKSLGIPIIYSDPHSIEEIIDDLTRLSSYSTHPEVALASAQKLRQQYQELQQKYASTTPHQAKKKSLFSLVCNPYLRHQIIHYKMRLPNFVAAKIFLRIVQFLGHKSAASK